MNVRFAVGRAFSSPYESAAPIVMTQLSNEFAHETLRSWLALGMPPRGGEEANLLPFLWSLLDVPVWPACVRWGPAVGSVRRALASGESPHLRDLVSLALDAMADADAEHAMWTARFPQPTTVVAASHLYVARVFRASTLSSELEVLADGFNHHGGAATRFVGRSAAKAPRVIPQLPNRVLALDSGAVTGIDSYHLFEELPILDEVTDAALECLTQGYAAVQRAGEQFADWVAAAIGQLVVTAHVEGMRLVSGSITDAPGVVHLSGNLGAMETAEILVHESSHQYFYALERLGSIESGTDSGRYWSPPIRDYRPVSRVLMAHHALVNVLGFYEETLRSGTTDGQQYVERFRPGLVSDILQLEAGLRNAESFSDLGQGLLAGLEARRQASRAQAG